MSENITIIGTPISPFVRKVLITLELKGIDYQCVPLVPFFPSEEFKEISPMRRVPVLKQGTFTLPDSSAIVQYLEDVAPSPSLFPEDVQDRARARWFEEYADEQLGRSAVFNLFFQKVVRPLVLKQPANEELIQHALETAIPDSLTYLEQHTPEEGYMFGALSIADISLTAMLLNATFADWQIDKGRWPKFAAYMDRVYSHPVVARYNQLAQKIRLLPHTEHQRAMDEFIAAI